MVKVIYTNGSELILHADVYEHNDKHKMFFVNGEKKRVMIPDHSVAAIGVWDAEKEEFIQ